MPSLSNSLRDGNLKYKDGIQNSGILQDGSPYFVYRMLIYCKEFNPSCAMYPQGSAGVSCLPATNWDSYRDETRNQLCSRNISDPSWSIQ